MDFHHPKEGVREAQSANESEKHCWKLQQLQSINLDLKYKWEPANGKGELHVFPWFPKKAQMQSL